MFESDGPDNYEKVYSKLPPRLAARNLAEAAADLGLTWGQGAVHAPCLGKDYLVDGRGVRSADGARVPLTHRIVLAHYLLHGGRGINADRFVPYRELPGGADFARSLEQAVEARLARFFGGRLDALQKAARALGGRPAEDMGSADGAWVFEALPKIPMMLTFYEADDEFPAEARTFYDLTAPNFLDLECLAALGLILVMELEAADAGQAG